MVVIGNFRGCSRKFSGSFSDIFVAIIGDLRGIQSTVSTVRASNIQQYRHPKCNIFVLI